MRPPPAVSKRKVVELRGKNERMRLDEYSTMVVIFLPFDLVLAGQRSNFREIGTFSTLQADIM